MKHKLSIELIEIFDRSVCFYFNLTEGNIRLTESKDLLEVVVHILQGQHLLEVPLPVEGSRLHVALARGILCLEEDAVRRHHAFVR